MVSARTLTKAPHAPAMLFLLGVLRWNRDKCQEQCANSVQLVGTLLATSGSTHTRRWLFALLTVKLLRRVERELSRFEKVSEETALMLQNLRNIAEQRPEIESAIRRGVRWLEKRNSISWHVRHEFCSHCLRID